MSDSFFLNFLFFSGIFLILLWISGFSWKSFTNALAIIFNNARSFARLLSWSRPDPWTWRWFRAPLRSRLEFRIRVENLRSSWNHLQAHGSGGDEDRSLPKDLASLEMTARALLEDFEEKTKINRIIKKIIQKIIEKNNETEKKQ